MKKRKVKLLDPDSFRSYTIKIENSESKYSYEAYRDDILVLYEFEILSSLEKYFWSEIITSCGVIYSIQISNPRNNTSISKEVFMSLAKFRYINSIHIKNLNFELPEFIGDLMYQGDGIYIHKRSERIQEIRHILLFQDTSNLMVENFKEFNFYIKNSDIELRKKIAENPDAVKLSYFRFLFEDIESEIRDIAAKNINSPILPEYWISFCDPEIYVRKSAAENPNAPNLAKFEMLFEDEEKEVRDAAFKNVNAIRFEKYSQLIK